MARERKASQIEAVLTLEDNVGAVVRRVKKLITVRLSDEQKMDAALDQALSALPSEIEL